MIFLNGTAGSARGLNLDNRGGEIGERGLVVGLLESRASRLESRAGGTSTKEVDKSGSSPCNMKSGIAYGGGVVAGNSIGVETAVCRFSLKRFRNIL